MKKIFSLVLIFAIAISMSGSAFAAEEKTIYEFTEDEIVELADILQVNPEDIMPLSLVDEEAVYTINDPNVLVDYNDPDLLARGGAGQYQQFFSMSIETLNSGSLLATSGTKNFKKADFLGANLRISGTVTSTGSGTIKCGAAYYSTSGTYVSVAAAYHTSGEYLSTKYAIADYLLSTKTYYGYCNNSSSGSVSGTLYFADYS